MEGKLDRNEGCALRVGWLLTQSGKPAGRPRVLRRGETWTIGRAAHVDLRIEDPLVLPEHARVVGGEQGVSVVCLAPNASLYVGGTRVQGSDLIEADGAFLVGRTAVGVTSFCEEDESVYDAAPLPGLVGKSPAMLRVGEQVRRWAKLGAPVLLQGETGCGKEMVARALHDASGRAGPYIGVNVGAMGENLADAELFGHRRGAFTGAIETRTGVFEAAAGGTLLLDEIGDLSAAIQVKLLRVLEEKRLRPLGSNKQIELSARIVSASWAPMHKRVEQGYFRADLFHRISTLSIEIPPLRKRRSDIAELAEYLLARHASELGPKRVTAEGLALLTAYRFPGNVRELAGILYRAAALAKGAEIDAPLLVGMLPNPVRKVVELSPDAARALVAQHGGNVSAAARDAQVPRTTFRALLGARG